MIKTIIFDFDGVIVESVDIKTAAFAELFAKEGKDAVKRIVEYHLVNAGISRYEKFKHIYQEILKRGLSEYEFKQLCDRFSELVMGAVVRAPYVKGAKEFLELWYKKYKCFVASATPEAEMQEIVRMKGLVKYFVGVYGAPKKKADVVKDVIERYHVQPGEIAYVGDAMSDYEAASANGIHFIARIDNNEIIFAGKDCIKMTDLSGLGNIVDKM